MALHYCYFQGIVLCRVLLNSDFSGSFFNTVFWQKVISVTFLIYFPEIHRWSTHLRGLKSSPGRKLKEWHGLWVSGSGKRTKLTRPPRAFFLGFELSIKPALGQRRVCRHWIQTLHRYWVNGSYLLGLEPIIILLNQHWINACRVSQDWIQGFEFGSGIAILQEGSPVPVSALWESGSADPGRAGDDGPIHPRTPHLPGGTTSRGGRLRTDPPAGDLTPKVATRPYWIWGAPSHRLSMERVIPLNRCWISVGSAS